jgi:hypothetical protein
VSVKGYHIEHALLGDKILEGLRSWYPICRELLRALPAIQWSPRMGLTLWASWKPSPLRCQHRHSCRPCHPRATAAGASGIKQSMTVNPKGRCAGRRTLTLGVGAGRTCMGMQALRP